MSPPIAREASLYQNYFGYAKYNTPLDDNKFDFLSDNQYGLADVPHIQRFASENRAEEIRRFGNAAITAVISLGLSLKTGHAVEF